jgi:hypothetical protein
MSDRAEHSAGFGFREVRCEYGENLPPQFRNIVGSRIPQYLPIQIKVCVDNPVPYRNYLPPGHFRVAVSQIIRQTDGGLADHRQMMQYRGR